MKNKHFRYGVPFVLTVVCGSFGLQYYSQVRYDIHKEQHIMTKTKEVQAMLKPIKQKSLEEEYEEYKKNVDLDNWKNIRGPRPWEDNNKEYTEMMDKRAEESKKGWIFKN